MSTVLISTTAIELKKKNNNAIFGKNKMLAPPILVAINTATIFGCSTQVPLLG